MSVWIRAKVYPVAVEKRSVKGSPGAVELPARQSWAAGRALVVPSIPSIQRKEGEEIERKQGPCKIYDTQYGIHIAYRRDGL